MNPLGAGPSKAFDDLVVLFNLTRKREVERHCRKLIIASEDLAKVILAGRVTGVGPYVYACHFAERVPGQLRLSKDEVGTLARSGTGQLVGKALMAWRKSEQALRDRQLLSVHLFYTRSQTKWHLFYFTQRDYTARENHWVHGPHIHYSQSAFTNEPLADVWRKATLPIPEFPPSVHVRYNHRHNRPQHAEA